MTNNQLSMFLALTGANTINTAPTRTGDIVAVNAATAFAASLAQDVSGYLASMPSTDDSLLLDLLAPPVETADFFQFAKGDDQFFLTEVDNSDIRALGASFKRIQNTGSIQTDATLQKGLTKRVEYRTLPKVNGQIRPGWENREAAELKNRLVRAELFRGLALLDAAANNTAVNWTTTPATANPDGDLRKMVERTRTKNGVGASHVMLGSTAQQARQDAYEAGARTNNLSNHGSYTMEQLASYLNVGKVYLNTGLLQLKKGAAKTYQVGMNAYSYLALANPTLDDASNIKRAWSPTKAGGMWATYIQEHEDWADITVFHQSKIFVPYVSGIEKLTVS